MRCRCCNNLLTNVDKPAWNKHTKTEEDMCSSCRNLVYNSYTEKEYVGGRYPVDGVYNPPKIKDN